MGREYRRSRYGWRMFTTSDCRGSTPMTPYCDGPAELAKYCARNCTAFGSEKAKYLTWLNFILSGDKYVPSVCLYKGEVMSGLNTSYRVTTKKKQLELFATLKQYYT